MDFLAALAYVLLPHPIQWLPAQWQVPLGVWTW